MTKTRSDNPGRATVLEAQRAAEIRLSMGWTSPEYTVSPKGTVRRLGPKMSGKQRKEIRRSLRELHAQMQNQPAVEAGTSHV